MRVNITWEGRAIQTQFSPCTLSADGEFTGNLDFTVRFSESMAASDVTCHLCLRLEGTEIGQLLDVVSCTDAPDGVTFHLSMHDDSFNDGGFVSPDFEGQQATVIWQDGTVETRIAGLPIRVDYGEGEPTPPWPVVKPRAARRQRHVVMQHNASGLSVKLRWFSPGTVG